MHSRTTSAPYKLLTYLLTYSYYLLLLLHPFNGLFSSRHQKGKPFWILLEQEIMGEVASAGPYANQLHLAADR